jgi:hypothetical protein
VINDVIKPKTKKCQEEMSSRTRTAHESNTFAKNQEIDKKQEKTTSLSQEEKEKGKGWSAGG